MFVNEPENRRTIDVDREITLKRWGRSREAVFTFMLSIRDKEIPFTATYELFPKNEAGVNPIIWTVDGIGGGISMTQTLWPDRSATWWVTVLSLSMKKDRSRALSRRPYMLSNCA